MGGTLVDRFRIASNGPAPTEDQVAAQRSIQASVQIVAYKIADLAPEGREQALALTALEEALMWSGKAIFMEKK